MIEGAVSRRKISVDRSYTKQTLPAPLETTGTPRLVVGPQDIEMNLDAPIVSHRAEALDSTTLNLGMDKNYDDSKQEKVGSTAVIPLGTTGGSRGRTQATRREFITNTVVGTSAEDECKINGGGSKRKTTTAPRAPPLMTQCAGEHPAATAENDIIGLRSKGALVPRQCCVAM
eukprot:CAMPEP_0170192274 /NCGR_PEP_ID=MMETSP0040_2-20121228/53733_1 /TAXON_ID=641309 /ORGANISM="Lotharella oceanica, Strain CCMP622" /LENGTH=172 /DNA_ID=CAMNT_0010440583 /DNA_START=4 /DNA_END=522 /DNA_ORIENTATION=+